MTSVHLTKNFWTRHANNLEKVHFFNKSATVDVFRLTEKPAALIKVEDRFETQSTSVSKNVSLSSRIPE